MGRSLTDHLRAELDHYTAATAALEPIRRRLFTEMLARTPLAEEGPAHTCGAAQFREVIPDGAQLGQFQRRAPGAQAWTPLVDLDVEAATAGSTYAEVGVREVSPDGTLLAWSLDVTGEELYELRFRDVATGADLPERMQRTYYGGAWSADGRTFFYTVVDHVYRPYQVWRHEIGTDPISDVLVLQEDDRRFELSVRATRCGRWVLIHAGSRDASETWAVPAADPGAAPVTVGGRRDGHEYLVESVPDGPLPFLAVTNHGGARDFTLSWLSLGATDPAGWRRRSMRRSPGTPWRGCPTGPGSRAHPALRGRRGLRRPRGGVPARVGCDGPVRGAGDRPRPGLGRVARPAPDAGVVPGAGDQRAVRRRLRHGRRAEPHRSAGLDRPSPRSVVRARRAPPG